MNIIQSQAEVRYQKINQIAATLKKAFDAKIDVDKAKFIYEICSELKISRRTAIEYLNTALISFNTTEFKLDGRVYITLKKEEK